MANYDCEIKILERDNKMLEEIANGNPELSEKLISYSIRHAINSATSTYIWMISELNRERKRRTLLYVLLFYYLWQKLKSTN